MQVGLEATVYLRFVGESDKAALMRFDSTVGTRKFPLPNGEERYAWEGPDGFAAHLIDPSDHFHRMYELRVRLFGDVAIVHGHYEVGGKLTDGRDLSADTRFTANWIRREGGWQCLMHHATRIDPGVAALER